MAAQQYRYSDHSMSSTLKLPEEDYDELEDECKRQNRQLALNFTRIGLVVVALVWGTFLLLNSIPVLEESSRAQPTTSSRATRSGKLKVDFEAVRGQKFKPRFQQLQWTHGLSSVHDDKGLFVKKEDDVYSLKSVFDENYTRELFRGNTFEHEGVGYVVEGFVAAPDLSYGLVRTNSTKNWRHSTFATYFVYSIEKRDFHPVGQKLAVAEWSPDSQRIAYVKDNDLYLHSVADGKVSRVTSDGSATIFNGRSDWVYEEEVLSSGVALWWSPTGKYVAYFKINEEQVHEFPIAYYLQEADALYPEVRKIKYPKSGTPNPIVTLNIFDVAAEKNSVVNFGDNATLITEVVWVGENQVLAKYMDRSAQVLTVALVSTDENKPFTTPRVESTNGGWWDVGQTVMYVPRNDTNDRANDGYIDVVSVNGYNHLAYYSPPSASTPTILTSGAWEVVGGPVAFDLDTNDVFFIATRKSSNERHLYYVNLFQPNDVQEVTDTSKEGVYDVSFSEGSRFLLLTYRGPGVPYQKLVDLKSLGSDSDSNGNVFGETLYYLEENNALKENLKEYSFNYPKFQELNLGDDSEGQKVIANSYEILPPDFDSNLRNHYPVFFFAYGGPGSQLVKKEFAVSFLQVVAAQLDAIVVVVDGRGTGFKGKPFRAVVTGDLGHYEAEDQIAAAKLYSEKYYVNKERISLFGWSYGGYLTLKTLERDAGRYFKYGIAVAPVTDWRLYDSVYTERYMSEPLSNPRGYADAKVHNVSALAKVPRFLLMHGTGDDNVHFQHTLVLLDQLNLAGVENYDLLVFPDSRHSIDIHNANVIVYDKILNWANQAYSGAFVDPK